MMSRATSGVPDITGVVVVVVVVVVVSDAVLEKMKINTSKYCVSAAVCDTYLL